MRIGMPLLFQELAVPRFSYKAPCVLSVKDLRFPARPVKSLIGDLPLSDLEFELTYSETALDQGRISIERYNYIKELQNY